MGSRESMRVEVRKVGKLMGGKVEEISGGEKKK